jgi:hypothetical protein
MPKFYDDLNSLQQVTLNLEFHIDVFVCLSCLKSDQFVSHGFIFHRIDGDNAAITGKRLLCCNRRGRSGCGRTLALYLKERQPKYCYSSAHINVFFLKLLAGQSIPNAYQIATGCYEPRNAYRWLESAYLKLVEYRAVLNEKAINTIPSFKMKSPKFKIVLSTLKVLFSKLDCFPCATFQKTTQQTFL